MGEFCLSRSSWYIIFVFANFNIKKLLTVIYVQRCVMCIGFPLPILHGLLNIFCSLFRSKPSISLLWMNAALTNFIFSKAIQTFCFVDFLLTEKQWHLEIAILAKNKNRLSTAMSCTKWGEIYWKRGHVRSGGKFTGKGNKEVDHD